MGKVLESKSLSVQGQSSQTESLYRIRVASYFEGIVAGMDIFCAKTELGKSQFWSLALSSQKQCPHEPKPLATHLKGRM